MRRGLCGRLFRGSALVTRSNMVMIGDSSLSSSSYSSYCCQRRCLFASSRWVLAGTITPDPEELQREKDLRAHLMKNPQLLWTKDPTKFEQQQQEGTTNSKDDDNAGASQKRQEETASSEHEKHQQGQRQERERKSSWSSGSMRQPGFLEVAASAGLAYGAYQLLQKVQGGDITDVMVPFWVSSPEMQARHLIFVTAIAKTERDRLQVEFTHARRVNPLLTFHDYIDAVAPWWCAGRRYTKDQIIGGLTEAFATLPMLKMFSLAKQISSHWGKGTTDHAAKIDDIGDCIKTALGGGGGSALSFRAPTFAPQSTSLEGIVPPPRLRHPQPPPASSGGPPQSAPEVGHQSGTVPRF